MTARPARPMPAAMILRLGLDLLAMALLLAALAYYWLGNAFHEAVGTAFFVLLLAHAAFNRWWWAALPRPPRTAGGPVTPVVNLVLLAAMAALLVSSVMISQTMFGLQGGVTARQVHRLAAYWALAVAALHLGLHWHMVMRASRRLLGLSSRPAWRAWGLRLAALALAAQGVQGSSDMALGSKLVLHPVLEMWDFEESVSGFFLRYGSIVALYAVLGHYGTVLLRHGPGRRVAGGDPA